MLGDQGASSGSDQATYDGAALGGWGVSVGAGCAGSSKDYQRERAGGGEEFLSDFHG